MYIFFRYCIRPDSINKNNGKKKEERGTKKSGLFCEVEHSFLSIEKKKKKKVLCVMVDESSCKYLPLSLLTSSCSRKNDFHPSVYNKI